MFEKAIVTNLSEHVIISGIDNYFLRGVRAGQLRKRNTCTENDEKKMLYKGVAIGKNTKKNLEKSLAQPDRSRR